LEERGKVSKIARNKQREYVLVFAFYEKKKSTVYQKKKAEMVPIQKQ